jgi:hypothetical protein
MGPVQVLVVGFDEPQLHGEVLSELARLREAGVVRLVDLLLLTRHEDGSLETVDMPAGVPEDMGELAAALLGRAEGGDGEDAAGLHVDLSGPSWSLADAVPVGSVVAVALIEHVWAAPLRDALARAGGAPIDETWLAADDVATLETLLGQPRHTAPRSD